MKIVNTAFFVSSACQLRCFNCKVWQPNFKPKNSGKNWRFWLQDNLKQLPFFKPHVHILGGDPTAWNKLEECVTMLKQEGYEITVWTHGVWNLDEQKSWLNKVDRVVVMMPTFEAGSYKDWTGEDSFDTVLNNLDLLASLKMPHVLNMPVLPSNIPELPYLYEMAYYRNIPFWIHYSSKDAFSKDSLDYIQRFRWVKNVWIFKTQKTPSWMCQAVPYDSIDEWWQWALNEACDALNTVRTWVVR